MDSIKAHLLANAAAEVIARIDSLIENVTPDPIPDEWVGEIIDIQIDIILEDESYSLLVEVLATKTRLNRLASQEELLDRFTQTVMGEDEEQV